MMKKLFLFSLLCMSLQAFAQICEVDMTDRYGRVVRTFRAYGDQNTCIEGMKECRKTIRLSPHLGGVDCVRRGGYNPPNQPNLNYYLSMSDYQLAQEAQYGIGRCTVGRGGNNSACDYYVRVNGQGFGNGSGCARQEYTRQYGCNYYSEFENAGCLIRISLQQRQCF
jgi:hypothetical protein